MMVPEHHAERLENMKDVVGLRMGELLAIKASKEYPSGSDIDQDGPEVEQHEQSHSRLES